MEYSGVHYYALNDDEYRNSHAGIVENLEKNSYSDYMSGDAQKDADFIEEEFTSSALSYLFSDSKNVKKFAQENFNVFQRVVDNVIHVFEKNISMYEGRDRSVREMYEPIIDKLKAQKKSIIQRYDDGISGKVDNDIYSDLYKQSIVALASGRKFVKASRQVIKSNSPEDWGNDVMKYINTEIRHGKDVSFTGMDGHKLFITRDTAGKARYRNSVVDKGGKKRTYTDDEYALKLRIESHIDEIAQASMWNGKPLEPDRKNHPFAKDGFSYRTAFFEDFDGQYYWVRFSVGHNNSIETVYNVGNIKLEGDPPRALLAGNALLPVELRLPTDNSLSQNKGFENSQNDENSSADLGNINESVNEKFSLPQGTIPESSKKQIDRILHRAGNRYGISDLSQDELSGVSLSQKDIDARLGREFAFDNDIRVQSQYRDGFNNSLHLSDSVIFRYGEGADASFGTGRILNFENDGSVRVCVDSGETYSNTITLDSKNVFFVAHNNMETVSNDFSTSNLAYSSAKQAFDHFGLTGDISKLKQFGFNRAQNYLFSSSNKVNAIYSKLLGLYPTFTHVDVRATRARWKNYGKEVGVSGFPGFKPKELTETSEIISELEERGIITNPSLWKTKCSSDQNAYWLARKICNLTKMSKGRNPKLETVNDIVWELGERKVITDTHLWMKLFSEDKDLYWLGYKAVNMTVNK